MYFSEYAPRIAKIENRPEDDVQEAILARWNHARRVAKEDGRPDNWDYAVSIFQRYMPRTWHQAMGRTRNPSLPEFESFLLARLSRKEYAPFINELLQKNISQIVGMYKFHKEGLPSTKSITEYSISFEQWLADKGINQKYAEELDEIGPMLPFAHAETRKRGIRGARRRAQSASEHNRFRDALLKQYERETPFTQKEIPIDFSKESDRDYARAAKMRVIRSRQAGR